MPDVLKGSRLVRVSAPTNREERNDRGKDRGEDRRWRRSGKQSGRMETLSKVNEQKDNALAPNTTLSPSPAWQEGLWEEGICFATFAWCQNRTQTESEDSSHSQPKIITFPDGGFKRAGWLQHVGV